MMSDVSKTTPRKVLRRAHELGVHADCIAADFDGACEDCIDKINEAFRDFYGQAGSSEEAMRMIIEDIKRDRE